MTAEDYIVFIVDDDYRVREALSGLLAARGCKAVTYGSAGEYIEAQKPDVPACVIMDAELADLDGVDFHRQMRDGLSPPVIFTAEHDDIAACVRAIKAGAIDYLTKPLDEEDLLEAVDVAIARDRKARPMRVALLQLQQRFAHLTPREREVLPLVVGGMRNKQAAAELGISEVTLQIHRSKIMHKMAAVSLPELVRMAGKLGLPASQSHYA